MQNKYKQTFSLQKCYEHLTLIEAFLSLKVQSSTQLAKFLCLQAVLSFPKQIEYLKHYKLHLTKFFGLQEAQKTIEDSFIVISAGSNDFIQNYYIYDNRSKEFTEPQYQDYLVARMSKYIKVCHPTFLNGSGSTRCNLCTQIRQGNQITTRIWIRFQIKYIVRNFNYSYSLYT